ncbi:MAG: DUF72 domain-containing protein [Ignavibacteria bacterium]|nr:DUF72 domain-containing protein [Ignavibacteria bacterium]
MINNKIRLGTCSWKYPDWEGIIYPETGPYLPLEEYSRHFSTVEIDQWFWSLHERASEPVLPKAKDVYEYASQVPGTFRFTIKAPNAISLTHYYQQDKSQALKLNPWFLSPELATKFIESIRPLKDLSGPIMFQFEYLNQQKMPSQKVFLDKLGTFISQLPPDFTYGIEIRNPQYINDTYFQFLALNKLTPVFLHGYYMPSVFPIVKKYSSLFSDSIIIRMHGPDRQNIEKLTGSRWDSIIAPKTEELENLAELILAASQNGLNVYINMNNHYEGCAPKSLATLQDILNRLAA